MGQKRGLKLKIHKHKDKSKDVANLNEQLTLLGLKVVPVTADGNCFFRAVADQLEGDEEQHAKYRQLVVEYLEEHQEEFEPFVEDEVPFNDYCKSMREDGTWAGHMELQASSLVNRCNICIHQLMTPRWHIRNFDSVDTTTIHLSYHDGEHYNSVRRQDDIGLGPAKSIIIEGDATPITKLPPMKGNVKDKNKDLEEAKIKIVIAGSGCTSEAHVRNVLRDMRGDADMAIEYLIAERSGEPSPVRSYESDLSESGANGTSEQINLLRISAVDEDDSTILPASNSTSENGGDLGTNNLSTATFEKAARNKACPCGSKRKYKSCCGTSKTKTTLAYVSRAEETLSNKLRKQNVKIAKGVHPTSEVGRNHPPEVLDMGALCI